MVLGNHVVASDIEMIGADTCVRTRHILRFM